MSRLTELLKDLGTMPGVETAFLFAPNGLLATTSGADPRDDDRVGRIHSNLVQGAFGLGHYLQDIYCDFDNAVIMTRPVGRGCILIARCKPGVSIRLVDISLTMTAKSLESEIGALDELPSPIDITGSLPPRIEDSKRESDLFANIEGQDASGFVDEDVEEPALDHSDRAGEITSDANIG